MQEILAKKRIGKQFSIADLLQEKDNLVIFGRDKSGKTSLLWKLLIDCFGNYYSIKTLPYLVDLKEFRNTPLPDVKKQMPAYLSINKNECQRMFDNEYKLLLLIDGAETITEDIKVWVQKIASDFPNMQFVITCSELFHNPVAESLVIDENQTKKLYIHDITPKEIRQLTQRWPNVDRKKSREIERKILQVFTQMNIPFNYWTASLFLWIFDKTDYNNIHNNFELIRFYIDELLNRKALAYQRYINLQYDDLILYLGHLAYRLLDSPDYCLSNSEWNQFTEEYRNEHKKLTESSNRIISMLLDNGVIVEKRKDRFTYRLNGVFQFFLAFYMTVDEEFRKGVVSNMNYFLSFGNEMELYSGFKPDDTTFVKDIYSRTREIMRPITEKPGFDDVDGGLHDRLISFDKVKEAVKEIVENVPNIQKEDEDDECNDILGYSDNLPLANGDVEVKRKYDIIVANGLNVHKALFILSRVYRNSRICDSAIGEEILNFVITGSCNLGFLLHEEVFSNYDFDEVRKQDYSDYLNSFLPLIVHTMFFDAISQNNLARVFEEKYKELKQTPAGNQFRIFLIVFTLIDLDINKYYYLLDELKGLLNKGNLRFMACVKASLIFSKEEHSQSVENALKTFISDIRKEQENKIEAQRYVDNLLRGRTQKLLMDR